MAAKLFFSYSHKDEDLRDQLEVHLAMLKRQGIIAAWHDRRITAGDDFGGKINAHIEDADVVLALVSADFLASDYCYEREMSRALERHRAEESRLIPVILRPCDWHSAPFGNLLAAPRDGKPITKWTNLDEAFLDVVNAIRRAVEQIPRNDPAGAKPVPVQGAGSVVSEPRSSNLRLRKDFSDADKDAFLEESFEYIARYFENSLAELAQRNPGIEGRFRRIDHQHFTAVVYRNGDTVARCRIWFGGPDSFASGIAYSENDRGGDNSFNEVLSVAVTDQALRLKPVGMAIGMFGNKEPELSAEGGAEAYWTMFINRLQR